MVDQAASPVVMLRYYFGRNGYVRSPRPADANPLAHRGYEARFAAFDEEEVNEIVHCLDAVGLRAGRPFPKRGMWRVPVYGWEQVRTLLDLVGPSLLRAAGVTGRRRRRGPPSHRGRP